MILSTSLIPEDVTKADNRLMALRSKPNGDCLSNTVSIILAMTHDHSFYDYCWLENCILTPRFMLTASDPELKVMLLIY